MPLLPLDHPEPFAATVGVMLYPGIDEHDQRRARAFASWWLAEPLFRYYQAGHRLSYEALQRIALDRGELLNDLDKRIWDGSATGELLKTLWALYNTDDKLTSWSHAIDIAESVAGRSRSTSNRRENR